MQTILSHMNKKMQNKNIKRLGIQFFLSDIARTIINNYIPNFKSPMLQMTPAHTANT